MRSSKVCLINPPTTDPSERSVYFPMALLTLAGALRECGFRADLWDFDLYFKKIGNSTEREFLKLLKAGVKGVGTKVFGISSICSNFPMAIYIAKRIKELVPDSVLILGGPQPSSLPREILDNFPWIDLVCFGEGERTLQEMARAEFDLGKMAGIPGTMLRLGSKIVTGPRRELEPDMDKLPMPDYSLINFQHYVSAQGGQFTASVEAGRGCPFHCTFCSTSLMWEKDFRVKSPARIFAEMRELHREHGFTNFDFIHDNFTTSRKFVLDFCSYLEEHNAEGFTWTGSSRTDCLDAKRLQLMHRAGMRSLFFGIESGSQRMQAVIKKNLDFTQFEPLLVEANRLGIRNTTAFILGFPEEEVADLDATFLRALHYRCIGTDRVFFSKLAALTGTSLYRDNLSGFRQISQTSTINPQNYGLPFVRNLILEHPALFSSFYHVPHWRFDMEYLVKFTEFSNLTVNGPARKVQMVLHSLEMTPSSLFGLWDRWAESKGIAYCDYHAYTAANFSRDFSDFLEEAILRDLPESETAQRCKIPQATTRFSDVSALT